VKAGEHYDVSGAEGNVNVASAPAVEADNLDKWAQQRDLSEDNSTSSRYVNRDVVGYSDLDDYGTWKQDPEYGNVWTPNNVSPDWAPYSNGYWSYVGPWGWTWVDYAPWGFAPFHYGRWVYAGGYWGWAPGPVWAYPYYGPAFVGFLGGFGFGVGFGWGWGHAWFPLGWGEPFHPWYHCGVGYWRNVNIHNTYIHNFNTNPRGYRNFNYAYAHNTHAVTTASHEAFTRGQAINRSSQHLTEASLRNAQVTNRINGAPTRTSALGAANARGNVARPSSGIANRNVMARTAPASGASHFSMNNAGAARTNSSLNARNNVNSNISSNRMSQLNANRPPSAQPGRTNSAGSFNGANRSGTTGRSWNAQGNATDSGRAPQGFGSSNRPSNSTAGANRSDRPPNAGNMRTNGNSRNSSYRPPSSYNNGRSYSAPSYNSNRPSYNGGYRGNSAPRNNGNYGSSRSYTAPRSYSAPRSSSGGGGYRGGGGGGHASSGGGGHASGGGGHSGGGHR